MRTFLDEQPSPSPVIGEDDQLIYPLSLEALLSLENRQRFQELMNVIRPDRELATILTLLEKMCLPENYVMHILFRMVIVYQKEFYQVAETEFNERIWQGVLFKFVLVNARYTILPLLNSHCLTFEMLNQAHQFATKLHHMKSAAILEVTIRNRMLAELDSWDQATLRTFLTIRFVTSEDKKTAYRLAIRKGKVDIARSILENCSMYISGMTHTKIRLFDYSYPYKRLLLHELPSYGCVVPREWYIRSQLSTFLSFRINHEFSVKPYRGRAKAGVNVDLGDHDALPAAPGLDYTTTVPEMKNGHTRDCLLIHRSLVATTGEGESIAIIHFTIFLDDDGLHMNKCSIEALSVHPAYQGRQLGQTLLHCAVFVALLYGCIEITLSAVMGSSQFYEKQGFRFVARRSSESSYVLDFTHPCFTFLKRVEMTAPKYFFMKHFASMIEKKFERSQRLREEIRVENTALSQQPVDLVEKALEWFQLEQFADACDRELFQFGGDSDDHEDRMDLSK